MSKKVTLQQIADELGTSKVTVSRALNGKPGISAALRERVLERVRVYGYPLPDKTAAPMARTFAFLVPQRFFLEFDQFYTVIYYHLDHLCQAEGIVLSSVVFTREEEQSGRLPSVLEEGAYDGVFLAGDSSDAMIRAAAALRIPLVFIDFNQSVVDGGHILADNYLLGYSVTNYLISRGHRRLGFVGDYRSNQNICDRYMGFRKALLLAGLDYDPQADIINNDARTGLYTLHFPMPQTLPTAFVCTCDTAAFYLYEKLKMNGLEIPGDISVVGFDNTDICENLTPPLTSMDINKKDFALLALQQMNKRLVKPQAGTRKLFVGTRLVERDSVRDITGGGHAAE